MTNYEWDIVLYYNTAKNSANEIIDILHKLGCKESQLQHVIEIIDGVNCGLTYSDTKSRKTCIVISRATSAREIVNSITHEALHLVQHVAKAYNLDMYSEEVCYLYGDLIESIFNAHPEFACQECYRKMRKF